MIECACEHCGHHFEAEPEWKHRVMCGDSTDGGDVLLLTEGKRFGAVVTDPPYGIDHEGIANDSPELVGKLYADLMAVLPLEPDAIMAAFHSPRMFPVWLDETRAAGWKFERMLWLHRAMAKTFPWHGWVMASDPILLSSIGSPQWPQPAEWCHDTYEKTSLEDAPTGLHTTIKLVAVVADIARKIANGSVYDPFLGSGTTLIAAEQTGRVCYGMEIVGKYVAVCLDRWQKLTNSTDTPLRDER